MELHNASTSTNCIGYFGEPPKTNYPKMAQIYADEELGIAAKERKERKNNRECTRIDTKANRRSTQMTEGEI